MQQATMPRTLFILTALIATGCGPTFRTPNLFHPGPAGPQRTEAIYHDPYPLDDVAPEIVGGRPREYQRPVPEVVRGRLLNAQPVVSVPGTQPGFVLPPPQPGVNIPAY